MMATKLGKGLALATMGLCLTVAPAFARGGFHGGGFRGGFDGRAVIVSPYYGFGGF
ncbi:MAG: hypothetical protein LLG20_02795 [Acidobacteriales bacterium]|nr:hypothetical protein [Terriglobales bacterium]